MKKFALALVFAAAEAQSGKIHINPGTRMFEDSFGRSVLFHGVNIVYKIPPYLPTLEGSFHAEHSLNAEDI